MKIDLSGLTVLLTGASGGIGQAVAYRLAESGASVALHYNKNKKNADDLAVEIGNGAQAFMADLNDPMDCVKLWNDVVNRYGDVDVLINNAGMIITSPIDLPDEEWLENWNKVVNVNLTASAVLSREAVKHFITRGGGRIINVASRAAFRGDTPEYMAYASAKSGMVAMSRTIARAYGKQGVKSFVVAPGFVNTEINAPFIKTYGEEFLIKDLALSTLTMPDDVAPTIVFLASGMMDHATGCAIDINAGSYVR